MNLKLLVLFFLLLATRHCYAQPDTTVTILPLQKLSICPGDTLHMHYTVSKRFQTGNTFLAELSSPSGIFSLGTQIVGNYLSDTSGNIVCNIPSTATAGNGYRIRIISSKPTRTSADNGTDITIKQKPVIAPSAVKVCQNNLLTLNAHSTTTGALVTWSGPMSYNSSGSPVSIPSAQVNMAGTYYATATLNGCSSYDSAIVTVNPAPITKLSTNSPVCLGDTMRLDMNWKPGTTNILKLPNGFQIINNMNYSVLGATPANAGTYMLVVKDTNNCSDTTYENFAVKPLPDSPKITSNSPICTGKRLQLFGLPGNTTNASFIWTGPGGYQSLSSTPFILNATAANAGVYTLRTFYNGCYSTPVSDTVVVVDIPEKPEGSSNSPLCEGDGMQLTTKGIAGAYYLWIGPNNFKSNIQNPYLPFASTLATGMYIIRDSISGGCVNYDTIYVEVNPYPTKTAITNNAPVCEGDTLKMHVERELAGTIYTWWGANGISDTGVVVNVAGMGAGKTGLYGVIANYKGCVTIGDTIDVDTKPVPLAPVAKGNGPLWEGQELVLQGTCPTQGVRFLWSGPNGFTDTGSTVYIGDVREHQSGVYFVSADKDGCTATNSLVIDIRKLRTTKDVAIVLYPSPNDGNFQLDIKTADEQVVPVSIHNQAGQMIHEVKLATDKKFISHSFYLKGQIAGGRYYLTAIVDGKKIHLPFVVGRN